MSSGFAESHVEEAALAWLAELGYATASGLDIGPDGDVPERASYGDVLLVKRVRDAIAKLNPTLAAETRAEVLNKLVQVETPSLVAENRRLHRYMIEGVPVEVQRPDGTIGGEQVQLIDFDDPDANDWLAVSQYIVIENKAKRRPDVVIFVNGLPLGVIELKNPGDENATLDGAFNQLQTYKSQITSLFRTNAALVISDGIAARIGSLTADRERFMPWRTVMGDDVVPKGTPELETVLKGVFDRRRFLDLIKDFIVFGDTATDVVKILAGYHQFHAVRKAVERTLSATAQGGDRKAGVIWHTQGSGKSLLMAFYAGQIIKHPLMQNPTLVVLTDRNDLDDQLFGTFSMCKDLLRQTPIQAKDRDDLRKLLDRPSGGVIFTTLQKFSPEEGTTDYPVLTDRRNVIVIADEAHRSQYGFRAKVESKTGDISYGFAKYLRDGLPNASFIGFTGTPIEKDDKSTPAVFGDYIDIYDISRAVEDGATVPIYYESRLARIELDEDEKPKIDAEIAELTEDEAQTEQDRLKRKWTSVEALVGSEKRLALVAVDLVKHFEDRLAALDGKGMIVCMSRRICVDLYDAIVKLRPQWHSDDDEAGTRLYLVVDQSGARRWAYIYHTQGKRREMGLGRMGLKEARETADEVRRQIRKGIDPITARRHDRSNKASIPTFENIAAEVIADAQERSTNDKVRYQWELLLGPRYCNSLLQKPINQITTLDIEQVLRPIWWSKPETGRKLLVRLRRVFDYARVHLRDRHGIVMSSNPAAWQDLRDRGFERISKLTRGRQAALDYQQAPEFFAAISQRQGIAARALEVTLLTGLRTGEVIGARWTEIDLERKTWVIPPGRLKDRKTRTEPHRVPLSPQVVAILKTLPRLGEFVFPGLKPGKPLSNMAMLSVLKDMNYDKSGEPRWIDPKSGRSITPHGLRATFRTWGEDAGFPRDLLEESLGHQIGTAVERAYRRTDSFDRRRAIMQAWADFCCGRPIGRRSVRSASRRKP